MIPQPAKLQSFECEASPVPPNTPAAPRPTARVRSFDLTAPSSIPSVQVFDCHTVDLPAGISAEPRPHGKDRRLSVAETTEGRGQVEQKVVSILLEPPPVPGKKATAKAEYFREYLSEGWKVMQLTSISTGGANGWIVVLLER